MQRRGLYVMCLALCCIHTTSELHSYSEDYQTNGARKRRNDDSDGLALSREIFKNITKTLRESIKREGVTDANEQLLQNKLEESRRFVPYQEYHHHEYHWGPYFEEKNVTFIAAHVGSEALLNCRIVMLKDKTVMWLRNFTETAQLLTVGPTLYAGDSRIAVKFQYPNNWRLSLNPVKRSDAGLYMCQISTHPPRTVYANLTVLDPVLTINGDQSHELKDRFYKTGSSIRLTCAISEDFALSVPTKLTLTSTTVPSTTSTVATTELTTKISTVFNRIDLIVNKSWSVETTTVSSTLSLSTSTKKMTKAPISTTELTTIAPTKPTITDNVYGLIWRKQGKEIFDNITWRNLSATFSVNSASQNDSGVYSCHLQSHSQVIVNVHVLIGENQAAIHHNTWNKGSLFWQAHRITLLSATVLFVFLARVSI